MPKEEKNAGGVVSEGKRGSRKPIGIRTVLSASEKLDDAYRRKCPDNMWKPPRSEHGLLQEDHAHDPWRVLIICMLLNRTTGLQLVHRWLLEVICLPCPLSFGENRKEKKIGWTFMVAEKSFSDARSCREKFDSA